MKTSRLESNSRLESDEVNYRLESNMEEAGEAQRARTRQRGGGLSEI